MAECKFSSNFQDYKCPEEPLPSGWCIFHDRDYLKDKNTYEVHKEEVLRELRVRIDVAITKNCPLYCIGFHLPELKLSELTSHRNFNAPIFFVQSEFQGRAIFDGVNFIEANFDNSKFLGEVNFSTCHFFGEANFSKAYFCCESYLSANFHDVVYFSETKFSNETNFKFAKFYKGASFNKAEFFGKTYFSEIKFLKGEDKDKLEGHRTDITGDFSESKFVDTAHFKRVSFSNAIANFSRVRFDGLVHFRSSDFLRGADFSYAIFSNKKEPDVYSDVNFDGTTFMEATSFKGATFSTKTSFVRACFEGNSNFSYARFCKEISFQAGFHGETYFDRAVFSGQTDFSGSEFTCDVTKFVNVSFESKEKVFFDNQDLSKVSFAFSDISRVTFGEGVKWGRDGGFKVIDEVELERYDKFLFRWDKITENSEDSDRIKEHIRSVSCLRWITKDMKFFRKDDNTITLSNPSNSKQSLSIVILDYNNNLVNIEIDKPNKKEKDIFHLTIKKKRGQKHVYTLDWPGMRLGDIKAIYRNLRENYEYKLRYEEAGKFFIREMELKRNYREVESVRSGGTIKKNGWSRRNLFSLTGWYYNLSRYGEDLLRPTLAGAVIIFLSTLFWSMQSNTTLLASFSSVPCNDETTIADAAKNGWSSFIGLCQMEQRNYTHVMAAFERSFADFVPLLPLGSNIKVGVIDYVIKIVGGALTFGLIAIALRRRFERKYRH